MYEHQCLSMIYEVCLGLCAVIQQCPSDKTGSAVVYSFIHPIFFYTLPSYYGNYEEKKHY